MPPNARAAITVAPAPLTVTGHHRRGPDLRARRGDGDDRHDRAPSSTASPAGRRRRGSRWSRPAQPARFADDVGRRGSDGHDHRAGRSAGPRAPLYAITPPDRRRPRSAKASPDGVVHVDRAHRRGRRRGSPYAVGVDRHERPRGRRSASTPGSGGRVRASTAGRGDRSPAAARARSSPARPATATGCAATDATQTFDVAELGRDRPDDHLRAARSTPTYGDWPVHPGRDRVQRAHRRVHVRDHGRVHGERHDADPRSPLATARSRRASRATRPYAPATPVERTFDRRPGARSP